MVKRKPEAAPGADGADGVNLLSLAAGLEDRGAPLESIAASKRAVGAHTGFIEKENVRPAAPRSLAQLGIGLLLPLQNRRFIALIRPAQRLLRGDVQRGQQPANRRQRQTHAKAFLDQFGHDLPGPQSEVKAKLPRILANDPAGYLCLLLVFELRRGPLGLAAGQHRFTAAIKGS